MSEELQMKQCLPRGVGKAKQTPQGQAFVELGRGLQAENQHMQRL